MGSLRIRQPEALQIHPLVLATLALGILPSGAVSFAEYASHSTLIEQGRQECAAHPDCHIQLQFDLH